MKRVPVDVCVRSRDKTSGTDGLLVIVNIANKTLALLRVYADSGIATVPGSGGCDSRIRSDEDHWRSANRARANLGVCAHTRLGSMPSTDGE